MQKAQEIELLPCPFCGSNAILNTDNFGKGFHSSQVKCEDRGGCGSESGTYTHKHQAVEAWNKRWMPDDVYTIRVPKEIIAEWNEPLDE